jgi:hypothetical protein
MTVCIASICEEGQQVVAATDGALTLGGVTSNVLVAGKMIRFGDWIVLWAGEPGNVDLVLENIRRATKFDASALTRENIRITVNAAFRKFAAEWATDNVLPAYDMDMGEFKKTGRQVFGDPLAAEIAKRMNEAVKTYLLDEMIVVGWGKTKLAALLHQRSAQGSTSHALAGSAAIGSGCEVALSTLLLLGQSRHSSLEETIYNVAAAKFMAEKSEDEYVGRSTAMCIVEKRPKDKGQESFPGIIMQQNQIDELHSLWEKYGRPRIPSAAMAPIVEIVRKSGMPNHQPSIKTMMRIFQAENALAKQIKKSKPSASRKSKPGQ